MLQVFTVHLGSVPTVVIADTAILKDLLARFVIITFFIHSLILIAEKWISTISTHPPSSSHADADGQEGGGRESSSLSHPWDYAGGIWENSHRIHNFSIWLCFKYIKWLTSLEQGSNLQKMKIEAISIEIFRAWAWSAAKATIGRSRGDGLAKRSGVTNCDDYH